MAKSAINGNIKSVFRRMIREEILALFDEESKNTSQNDFVSFDVAPTGVGSNKPKRPKAKQSRGAKGRVTNPNDKRLKANREL